MADTKEKAVTGEDKKVVEEKTTEKRRYENVFIPQASANEESIVFVAVNGKSYSIPKGTNVSVPAEVAYVLNRSAKARKKQFDYIKANAKK